MNPPTTLSTILTVLSLLAGAATGGMIRLTGVVFLMLGSISLYTYYLLCLHRAPQIAAAVASTYDNEIVANLTAVLALIIPFAVLIYAAIQLYCQFDQQERDKNVETVAAVFVGALLGIGMPRAIGYTLTFLGWTLTFSAAVTARYHSVLRAYYATRVEDFHKIKRLIKKHDRK